jgi:predicted small secreted protein
MNSKLILSALVISSLTLTSCASIQNGFSRNVNSITNTPSRVLCYSGGKEIYNALTSTTVESENGSDGYRFRDKDGNNVEINGDCIVTTK